MKKSDVSVRVTHEGEQQLLVIEGHRSDESKEEQKDAQGAVRVYRERSR